jgi:hypothetical protein
VVNADGFPERVTLRAQQGAASGNGTERDLVGSSSISRVGDVKEISRPNR